MVRPVLLFMITIGKILYMILYTIGYTYSYHIDINILLSCHVKLE